jgi:hypothetical protein
MAVAEGFERSATTDGHDGTQMAKTLQHAFDLRRHRAHYECPYGHGWPRSAEEVAL